MSDDDDGVGVSAGLAGNFSFGTTISCIFVDLLFDGF